MKKILTYILILALCFTVIGGIVAILGIVAAPITSGDTALRSARLIMADLLHIEQKSIRKRLYICLPLFLITMAVLVFSLTNADGFKIIWRYFAWSNQTLAVFTLWAITVYLVQNKKNYWITLIPAIFMTCVTFTYIMVAPEGFCIEENIAYILCALVALISIIWFIRWKQKRGN